MKPILRCASLVLLLISGHSSARDSLSYHQPAEVLASAGGIQTSASYTAYDIAEPWVGAGASVSYTARHGYLGQIVDDTLTPIDQWKLLHLGNAAADNLGDPDGDNLLTLVEYGLNTLPQTSSAAPAVTGFEYPEGDRLRLFIERDPAHNDVTIEVQFAGAVAGPWATVASSAFGAPFSGPGYVGGDSATPGLKTVEIRDTVNLIDATQRFLRVKVTH